MDPKFKALSDLVVLMCQVVNSVIALPKPLSSASLTAILPLLPQIEVLLPEIGDIPKEVGELDEAALEALLSEVGANLKLADAKAEAVVIASLKVLADIAGLVEAVKA